VPNAAGRHPSSRAGSVTIARNSANTSSTRPPLRAEPIAFLIYVWDL